MNWISCGKRHSPFLLLPLFMLALASLACDLEQNMGSLKTEETYLIEVKAGWEYDWSIKLSPAKKYEMVLAQVSTNTAPIYSIVDVVTGVLCEDCVKSAEGYVTEKGLSIPFVAPENGKARIRIYVREGAGKCTLFQVGLNTSRLAASYELLKKKADTSQLAAGSFISQGNFLIVAYCAITHPHFAFLSTNPATSNLNMKSAYSCKTA